MGIYSSRLSNRIDKKQVIIISSAIAALSAAALFWYSKKRNGKKTEPKEKKEKKIDNTPVETQSTEKPSQVTEEQCEVDFSLATTPDLVMNMALNYLTAKDYPRVSFVFFYYDRQ